MARVENHVAAFYELGGETIPEVAKNFATFEKSLTYEGFDCETFFSSIEPTNFRQELFQLKLLRSFNRHEDLFQILLKDRKIISKLALKDCGLIKRIASMSREDLVGQVLEKLSYTTRTQLINKLSFSVEDKSKGLELYKAVLEKYGMKVASPLLIACTEDVIIEAIEEHEVKFSYQQLIRCYKNSPRMLELYLKKNLNFQDYPKLGQYLCLHDLTTFNNLLKFGIPKIGRKAFINYLRMYKNEFIKDADKLRPLIRHNILSKYLTEEEFVTWIGNLLPKNFEDFCSNWELIKYFEMIPYKIRGRVLFSAFKIQYGFDIWSIQDFKSMNLLDMLSLDDRRKFDLINFPEYESTDKSIPILEHKLSLTNRLNERISLMRKILESCKINHDYDAFLGVLKKFTKYQKNEQKRLHCEFMRSIPEFFDFKKFNKEHFEYIEKIIMHFHLNNDYSYAACDPLQKLIEYKISNGLDYYFHLKLFCKFNSAYESPTFSKKPEEQREGILKHYSVMQEVFVEESDKNMAKITFISMVVAFNHLIRYNSEMQIPLLNYEDALEIVIKNLKEKYPTFYRLKQLLNSLYAEGGKADDILNEIFITSSMTYQPNAPIWFLRKKPHIIENNIDALFKGNKLHTKFCYELSKLEKTKLKKKVVDYAIEVLRSSEKDTPRVCSSLKIISFCPEIDFEEFTKDWLPIDCKIDVHKEDMKELFEIQKSLILAYKNQTNLQEVIPNVLQFCNGDYLQYALDPLYYVCNNIPERDLIFVLNELLKRSVSVRKHALHLVTLLTSIVCRRKMLKSLAETEQNMSVKRLIIKKLCKCLQNDRLKSDSELFSSHLNFIDPDDEEIITELLSQKNIPKTYYTQFVYLLWRHLCDRRKSEEFQLLDNIDYNKFIYNDLCKEIISESLFNQKNKFAEKTYLYAFKYLKSEYSENLKVKVEFIWECIRQNCKTADPYNLQKYLHEFSFFICKQVLQKDLESENNGLEIIQTMHYLLPSLKVTRSNFHFNLLLDTTKHYLIETNFKSFANHVIQQLKLLVNEFGVAIISVYANFLSDFLKILPLFEERFTYSVLDFIEEILQCDNTSDMRVFCASILPSELSKDDLCLRKRYFSVLQRLDDKSSDIVNAVVERVVLSLSF